MNKYYYATLLALLSCTSGIMPGARVKKIQKQTCANGQNCAYNNIDCAECCKAKTGVSPECCAACNNCVLWNDGGKTECKFTP